MKLLLSSKEMPVKVLDATGAGTYANVALGIRYAAALGATPTPTPTLELTLTPTPTPKAMCWNGNYQ